MSAQSFPVGSSIDVVAMSALGGIGLMSGTVLGALYVIGVPRFLPLDNAGLAATALGWLLLLLYVPSGLVRIVAPLRRRVLAVVARREGSTRRCSMPGLRYTPRPTRSAPADR